MAKHADLNCSSKKIWNSTKLNSKDAPKKITFTPEQGQILGEVYQLILGWRRERLGNKKQTSLTHNPIDDSKNIQPISIEVEG